MCGLTRRRPSHRGGGWPGDVRVYPESGSPTPPPNTHYARAPRVGVDTGLTRGVRVNPEP